MIFQTTSRSLPNINSLTSKKRMTDFTTKFSPKNVELFLASLSSELASNQVKFDYNLNYLIEILSKFTNKFFPLNSLTRKQYRVSKKPWITKGLLISIKHKNKLYAHYLKKKSPILFTKYQKYRYKLSHIKETSKQNYYSGLLNNSTSPSDTWKSVNMILNRQKPTSSTLQALKINNDISLDPVEICESLNKHFVSIGKKLSSSLNNQSTNHKEYMAAVIWKNLTTPVFKFSRKSTFCDFLLYFLILRRKKRVIIIFVSKRFSLK